MTELTTNAKSLLEAAKRAPEGPSDEAVDRMEREVLLAVGLAATATASTAAAVKGASLWSAAVSKILLSTTLLVVGGVVGAAIVWRPKTVAPVPSIVEGPAPAPRAAPVILAAPVTSIVEAALASAPIVVPPAAPPPAPVQIIVKGPRARAPIVAPPAATPPDPGPPPPVAVTPAPPSVLPTAPELSVLRSALQHIDALEWSEGIALLDRHDAEFPDGALRDEADVLRVVALCGLERVSAAFDLAVKVRARAPRSPALARLSATCVSP